MAKFIPKDKHGKSIKKAFVTAERKKINRVRYLPYSLALNLILTSVIVYLLTNN